MAAPWGSFTGFPELGCSYTRFKKNLSLGCFPPFTLVCACWLHPSLKGLCTTVIQVMVSPDGVRLSAAPVFSLVPSTILDASQCLGSGLGVSFGCALLASSGLVHHFPDCNVIFCPVSRPAGCTRKMVFDIYKTEMAAWLYVAHSAYILLPGVAPCWLHPKLVAVDCCNTWP